MVFSIQIDQSIYRKQELLNSNVIPFCSDWLSGNAAFIVRTSGSTGVPKEIAISREQMKASVNQTQLALGLHKGDSALICLSLEHIAGKMMLVRTMELGLKATLVDACANPFTNYQLKNSFDFIALVPLQIEAIIESDAFEYLNNSKAIIIGGGAISSILEDKLQNLKAPVFHTYGMTETVSHVALRRLNGIHKSDVYQELADTIITQDDRGCLIINSKVTNGLNVITNDLVELCDGGFKWLGRADNIINSGGLKIIPEKLEKVFGQYLKQEGLSRVYFIRGAKNDKLGEELVLYIEGEKLEEQSILEFFRCHVSRFEVPKKIIFIPTFEYTESGKINLINTVNSLK